MKLRKSILSLTLSALMLLSLLTVPAFAAEANIIELDEFTIQSEPNYKGWSSDGTDKESTYLTAEQFTNSQYLVLEFAEAPTSRLELVWLGDGNNWSWSPCNVIGADGQEETYLVIDLSETLINYELYKQSLLIKLMVGYFNETFEDLQLTRAYFTDVEPVYETPEVKEEQEVEEEPAAPAFPVNDAGVLVTAIANDDVFSGITLVMGNDTEAWPYASGANLAFTPEKDSKYRMTFEVTSTGTVGLRVRWSTDDGWGTYTATDEAHVNDNVYAAEEIAYNIPAYFKDTLASGDTKTFVVEFTMDGSQEKDGLIGNLAVRGQYGTNDFVVNSVKLEKLIDGVWVAAEAAAAPEETEEPADPMESATSWAVPYIEKGLEYGIITEEIQGEYTKDITRAEFCRMAVNFVKVVKIMTEEEIIAEYGLEIDPTIFTDTDDSDILLANALGIVNGRGDGIFDPEGLIIRQEAAAMLQRVQKTLNYETENSPDAGYADSDEFAAYAIAPINYVTEAGIMNGVGNNTFAPKKNYTREESVTTFVRMYEIEPPEEEEEPAEPEEPVEEEPEEPTGTLVFKLDGEVADIIANSGSANFTKCGSPTYEAKDAGMLVINRKNDFDCLDIKNASFEADVEYRVVVTITILSGDPAHVTIKKGGGDYSNYAEQENVAVGETCTLTAIIKNPEHAVRIQTHESTGDFFIESVEVYKLD